jgi:hypothetical protein
VPAVAGAAATVAVTVATSRATNNPAGTHLEDAHLDKDDARRGLVAAARTTA